MKKNLYVACGFLFTAVMGLTACTNNSQTSETKIEGLDSMGTISVVTREEGSGTRGVFAEKLGLDNQENSSNADNIRSDAKIAMNADAVLEQVAEDENAIGYVSLAAISGDNSNVKVLGVDGVWPDQTTIGKSSYPLTRSINIAYSGKNTAVGNDFLTYIESAGQTIASESFTRVKTPTTFLSDQSKGTLTISGSSSAAPLLEDLVKDYQSNYNKKADIQVQTTDSTAGLTAAMQGSCDWGMSSRDLKDYEKELLTYETIAKDGVAIVVNEKNPCETLTKDQLTGIFDGTYEKWTDLNQ